MAQVICNKAGKTPTCPRCPHGVPHSERLDVPPPGFIIDHVLCTEKGIFRVECVPVAADPQGALF